MLHSMVQGGGGGSLGHQPSPLWGYLLHNHPLRLHKNSNPKVGAGEQDLPVPHASRTVFAEGTLKLQHRNSKQYVVGGPHLQTDNVLHSAVLLPATYFMLVIGQLHSFSSQTILYSIHHKNQVTVRHCHRVFTCFPQT